MVTLHEGGVYLINGTTLVDCDGQEADAVLKETGAAVSQKEARRWTGNKRRKIQSHMEF